ncbi:alpha/beta fold hydrolase [Micromonospora sp. NPDC050417]|uniref:alpha/beta fold hydrolase n=1 Tax=Micromonospora sp. NPDC050417 TaxID=3364280 RepID=UPI0037B980F2
MGNQQLLDVNGLRLGYRTSGEPDAPAMVLLHGGGGDGSTWDAMLTEFADRWRVHALDLRGHGRSDRPGHYSVELMRDDLVGFLDGLGLDRVTLIGHSLGGVVAYLFAAAYPDRVQALVLEETPPPVPLGLNVPQRPDGPLPYDWAVRPAVIRQLNAADPSWREELPRITAPTLVIAGGSASHLPQDQIADMAARLPAGRLVTIPAGHQVHANRPAEFVAKVRAFLGTDNRIN